MIRAGLRSRLAGRAHERPVRRARLGPDHALRQDHRHELLEHGTAAPDPQAGEAAIRLGDQRVAPRQRRRVVGRADELRHLLERGSRAETPRARHDRGRPIGAQVHRRGAVGGAGRAPHGVGADADARVVASAVLQRPEHEGQVDRSSRSDDALVPRPGRGRVRGANFHRARHQIGPGSGGRPSRILPTRS